MKNDTQSRSLLQYLIISLKGIAMGAADAVPGVSGGTIAFISGIYEELVGTISNVNLGLFKAWRTSGFKAFWKQANGSFLLALLTGIAVSFVSFMRLAKYLIEYHPIYIWSFFFGLIIASIIYIGKQIKKWNLSAILFLALGAILAYYITTLEALGNNDSSLFLFFAGAIAICAMILPGISGSFILVILGAYKTLSNAIHDFDLKKIALFAGGALLGIISFSKLLKWLFKKYENNTLAILTGFIIGSLNKIWPWKETISVYSKEAGKILPMSEISKEGTLSVFQKNNANFESHKVALEQSISPFKYAEINQGIDPLLWQSILFMVLGIAVILLLEQTAKIKQ